MIVAVIRDFGSFMLVVPTDKPVESCGGRPMRKGAGTVSIDGNLKRKERDWPAH